MSRDVTPLLSKFLNPFSATQFVSDVWGRRSLYVPGPPEKIEALWGDNLGLRQVEGWVASALEKPTCGVEFAAYPPVAEAQRESDMRGNVTRRFFRPESMDSVFEAGHNSAVYALHLSNPRLATIRNILKTELSALESFSIDMAVLLDGIVMHFNPYGWMEIVLQGAVRMNVGEAPVQRAPPSAAFPTGDGRAEVLIDRWNSEALEVDRKSLVQHTLTPGDVLYVPAGTWFDMERVSEERPISLRVVMLPRGARTVMDVLVEQFLASLPAWREGPPAALPSLPGHVPATVAEYFDARLTELKNCLADLKPDSFEMERAWRAAVTRPRARRRPTPETSSDGPVGRKTLLSHPSRAPLVAASKPTADGTNVCLMCGDAELEFEDANAQALAVGLLRNPSFQAERACTFGDEELPWEEIKPLLEALVAEGLLEKRGG